MSALSFCAVCDRPLDDDRKRRSDAVTCSRACRTALWRARRKIRRDGGVPYVNATSDGHGSIAAFEPPASVLSDSRFRAHLEASQAATREPTAEDRRVRRLQRANPGVLLEPLRQRLIANGLRARALEEAEPHHPGRIAVQDAIHNPDPTVVARRGHASRQANRHITGDPNAYVDKPYTGPRSGPSRYPGAPEAEMTDAPWGRSTRW